MNKFTNFLIIGISIFIFISCGSTGKKSNDSSLALTTESVEENSTEITPDSDNIPEIIFEDTVDINETQYFAVKSPTECSLNNQNKFVYEVMHDSYLWNQEVDELDYTTDNYDSPEKLLEEIKSSNDRFSFIIDYKTAQSYFEEGKNENFGFSLGLAFFKENTYALVIKYVYPNSPADKKGIKRGDVITLVDSKTITEESLDNIIEIFEKSNKITLTFWHNNMTYERTIEKKSYDINPILYTNIFQSNKHKVGYMVFQDFIDKATMDIDFTFFNFKREGINDLILDLRYNGGGSENLANHIASIIGGSNLSQKVFHHVNFNEKYSQYNTTIYFQNNPIEALNLNRVFVITTEATCSASELVINALRASANGVEVIQIGKPTCGKPYGFLGAGIFCDKALYAINIETKNSDGDGDYTEGLTPTCIADDNIFKNFGEMSESSLNEALYYIANERCSGNQNIQKLSKPKTLSLPQKGFRKIMSAY
ncbi:Carboxyl-terminal protease [hydrothermal vent metagenome]|uniref:Carboxyl-terminal protease n=1 Tax=hydrothermal vent metagenome TaxID=652676 RepID=A0A1W1D1Q7_9ZZZZ